MMKDFFRDESGATAIEYAFIAVVISVVCIGALTLVGGRMSSALNYVATSTGSTLP